MSNVICDGNIIFVFLVIWSSDPAIILDQNFAANIFNCSVNTSFALR